MSGLVSKVNTVGLDGIVAELVETEADLNVGLHSFNIVGLADKAVSEAKERVNSALKNSGFKPPSRENRRITINLAPADIKKAGAHFDLPIAIAYLLSSGQLKTFDGQKYLFLGELSLNGDLRPVAGVLNAAIFGEQKGFTEIFVPQANAREAAMVQKINVRPAKNLLEIVAHLENSTTINSHPEEILKPKINTRAVTWGDVKGQENAKRAMLIAAAGGHHVLLSGPPGTGKTLLAQAFASILTTPEKAELLEINRIYSAAGLTHKEFISWRPFRAPHHTASPVSVLGGGSDPKPGEISLAHRGVLFLDELPEFRRDTLEGLRQPLEDGRIRVARAKSSLEFPARFTLIAAMNPCPCGYFGDKQKDCRCSAHEIMRYQKKVSGPLLDRFDIQLEVPRLSAEEIRNQETTVGAAEVARARVEKAKSFQKKRFSNSPIFNNAEMSAKEAEKFAELDVVGENFLKKILENNALSPRGFYRLLKVARTIADLDQEERVNEKHLAEAYRYRVKETKF
jgi:magnesium chelatase family protein